MTRSLLCTLALSALGLGACASNQHTMRNDAPATVIACSKCYDQVYANTHWDGGRWHQTVTTTETKHMCPDCGTETSIQQIDGKLVFKCAKCAPEGVACDKCQPPKGWTPPPESATAK